MGAALLALAAAVIGGGVSLVSVLLTQRGAERGWSREHERIERHRQEDRIREWDSRLLEERRAAYTRLHAAARAVRDALAGCMHDLRRDGALKEARRTELEDRWSAYVVQHAESHMIVSDEVLPVLGAANGPLRKIYGLVKRLDSGLPRREESVDELSRRMDSLWEKLSDLRDEMRRDLGVTERVECPSR
ncbi:hypothetical protein GCM10010330_38290 [Streptomyces tendae]|uniref:hypothetical protein n=1 Tax=Streptomyces tendae TaxID=1932 RepID=UPI001679707E|nr:hypothetical protein [Streptomyces tendae]GHA80499.1 hypothetical protein GCM10010330_38290 [Streptomyces tendae]